MQRTSPAPWDAQLQNFTVYLITCLKIIFLSVAWRISELHSEHAAVIKSS